jgi:hypothetical protein
VALKRIPLGFRDAMGTLGFRRDSVGVSTGFPHCGHAFGSLSVELGWRRWPS